MFGIPCEHACAIAMYLRQNIADLVDDVFKCPTQENVYSGMVRGIETHAYQKWMTMVLSGMLLAMFTSL